MTNNIALMSAGNLYSFLLDHPDFFETLEMQFVPIEHMPKWVPAEHQSEKCIGLLEHDHKFGVCLILLDGVEDTLEKVISGSKKMVVYEVDSIRDVTGICFCAFSAKRFLKVYRHLFLLSQKLDIPVPAVLFVDSKEFSTGAEGEATHVLAGDGSYEGSYIRIVKQGFLQMLTVLSHEMRHVWQMRTDRDFYWDGYQPYKKIGEAYFLQKAEIDAKAYSVFYMDSLGHDGMHQALGFDYEDVYMYPEENVVGIMEIKLIERRIADLKKAAS